MFVSNIDTDVGAYIVINFNQKVCSWLQLELKLWDSGVRKEKSGLTNLDHRLNICTRIIEVTGDIKAINLLMLRIQYKEGTLPLNA